MVGILAVDPSSPFTGGALLGDRIRMQALSTDPGIFIRSMATRGHMGGLAAATADVIRILDAGGRNPILVETVGVGQDEVDIVRLADVSVVTLVPGMGDDIQALKAGIMEIGDIFVINKCDHPGVDRMERALTAQLSLAHRPDGSFPPIVKTIATEGKGSEELKQQIDAHLSRAKTDPLRLDKQRESARQQLTGLLQDRLVRNAIETLLPGDAFQKTVEGIARHELDPHSIVEKLLGPRRKIDHLGIAVKSIEQALPIYEGLLGLRVSGYEDVAEQGVRVAMIPIGNSRLELLEPLHEGSPIQKFLSKRGEGIHHIAICVENITSVLDRLAGAGIRLIDRTPKRGAGNSKIAFIHPASTRGVLLELVEYEG